MSDPTVPHVPHESPDATPTQSLPLGDQQPAAMPAPAPARGRHTRTILEVVGGVVAVMMILVAGAAGFVVGHATGSDDVPRLVSDMDATGPWHDGPTADGPFGGLPGMGGERGDGRHGSGEGRGPGDGHGPGQGREQRQG